LIEIETEKAVQAVPCPQSGIVRKIYVQAEDQVRDGALLCVLTDTADEPFDDTGCVPGAGPSISRTQRAPEVATPLDSSGIKAAPAARKRAKDLGINLGTIIGSGPGGRITVEDVEKAGPRPRLTTENGVWKQVSPRRRGLIAQMQRSLSEIPQFHVARQLAVEALLKGQGATFTARLIQCLATALAEHPPLRTVLRGEEFRVAPVSVAVAIDTAEGVVAPALRASDLRELDSISNTLRDMRARAQEGRLRQEELDDAPFALSNLGMHEVDWFSPFLFHGQTAVLAVGRASSGSAWFNLAADHRVVDGAEAARFLQTLQQRIAAA
jgi:pyruvate dehydrogenase E2 component (dihydrolipoamide acetyltransferase)